MLLTEQFKKLGAANFKTRWRIKMIFSAGRDLVMDSWLSTFIEIESYKTLNSYHWKSYGESLIKRNVFSISAHNKLTGFKRMMESCPSMEWNTELVCFSFDFFHMMSIRMSLFVGRLLLLWTQNWVISPFEGIYIIYRRKRKSR